MKKLLYSVIGLATLLFAAGCQREVNTTIDDENIVEVTFNVGLDGIRSKADANYSTGTGATHLDVLVYNTTSGEAVYLPNVSKTGEKAIAPAFQNAGLTENVTLKLIKGASYDVLFWAQNPDSDAYALDAAAGTITVATGTEEVPVPANDESRDAFFGYTTVAVTASFTETVQLKRPFAQINVLDRIDDWNAALDNSIAFAGSSMTVTAPTILNLHTGAASEPAPYFFGAAAVDTDNPNIAGYGDDDKGAHYKYIAMNYILADAQVNADLEFKVYNGDLNTELFAYPVANVPYQRNYRTNIIGDIFSADGIFTVVIKPAYEDPDYVVTMGIPVTIEADSPLAAAIEAGSATFDETSKTGTVSLVLNATAATTLDFGAVIPADNLDIKPTYTSSDVTVGTISAAGVFTALTAGKTVITIHYNAIANGVEVKGADGPDYDATDIIFEVTVSGEAPVVEPTLYTVTISDALVGGAIEADAESAPAEDIVLLTITPNDGYHYVAGSVTVTGVEFADMQEEITDTDITVAFAMPEQNVVVSATFEEDETPEPGYQFVGNGTVDNPYTATDMIHYIDALESYPSSDEVYIKGKVNSIANNGQFASTYGNATFWISEDGSAQVFEAYRVLYLENRKWVEGDAVIAVGDEVVIYSKVTKYTPSNGDPVYETHASTKDPVYNGYLYSLNGQTAIEPAQVFGASINNTNEVSANGGTKTITITGNVDWTITADEGLTLSAASGNGGATVTVTVPANTDTVNGKTWNVTVKTEAEVTTKNFPFSFTQAKKVEQQETPGVLTAKVVFEDFASENNWSNGVRYETVELDDVVTATALYAEGKPNTGKYYTSGFEWRFYQNETAQLKISLADGYVLTSVTPTFNINNTGALLLGDNAVSSESAVEVSGSEVVFSVGNSGTATNGQIKFTAIEVKYKAE